MCLVNRLWDIEGRRRWAHDVEPTTLRADDFEGRRLWGQTTLRADDFEGRRLWGQVFCTLKIFALNVVCPQCRTTLRANIVVLEQFRVIRLKKIFALKVATLRAKLFWKTHQNPTWQNCQNFQKLSKLSKILDIWCHHLGDECFYWIYAANFWKKYVNPSHIDQWMRMFVSNSHRGQATSLQINKVKGEE